MGIFDANIIKNLILNIKMFCGKTETIVKIAERKAEEDTEQYLRLRQIEYTKYLSSSDPSDGNISTFPYQEIEEYRKQRFEYYLNLLSKQPKQQE